MRNISVRGNNNAAISSTYVLYANGGGLTYWSNTVLPENISSLSTSITLSYISLSTLVSTSVGHVYTDISGMIQSTYKNTADISTLSSVLYTDVQNLNTQIADLSGSFDNLYGDFEVFSNQTYLQVNGILTSTINFTESTLYGISSVSTFFNEIAAVQSSVNFGLSSMSTALSLQNISSFSTLTVNYIEADGILSTNLNYFISSSAGIVNANVLQLTDFSTFSSIITQQLLSTSDSLQLLIQSTSDAAQGYTSTVYYSSVQQLQISTFNNTNDISTLFAISTTLSTSLFTLTSSFVSTLFSEQSVDIYNQLSTLSTNVSVLYTQTSSLFQYESTISSLFLLNVAYQNGINYGFSTSISTLANDVYLLTSTGLTQSLYLSFEQLLNYTEQEITNISTTVSTTVGYIYISSAIILNNVSSLGAQLIDQISTVSSYANVFLTSSVVYVTSSITAYNIILSTVLYSTNNAILSNTSSQAASTLYRIENSTLAYYNNFTASLLAAAPSMYLSTLYTNSTINLTSTNFTGVMNLANFTNFNINVYGIVDGLSNYMIDYDKTVIDRLNYQRGVITINVSTIGQPYTNFNSKLLLNVNRWGIPTTSIGNVIPFISSSAYSIQYEYTLINKVMYTNVLNVFPRIFISSPIIVALSTNVYINLSSPSNTCFLRGTPLAIQWQPVNLLPPSTVISQSFVPDVEIDLLRNGSVYARYFTPFTTSTLTIAAPYLTRTDYTGNPLVPISVNVFVTGTDSDFANTSFTTLLPAFTNLTINNSSIVTNQYLGGQELVEVTELGKYPFAAPNSATASVNLPLGASPFYQNSSIYTVNNLFNGIINTTGALGASETNIVYNNIALTTSFSEATITYPDFYVNLPSYFNSLSTLQKFGSQLTFTLSNVTKSYTFVASTISSLTNTTFRLLNTSVSKPTRTFTTGDTAVIKFTYSQIPFISSVGTYFESTFLGPTATPANISTPATFATYNFTGFPLASNDLISTLTFYNLVSTPIGPVSTQRTLFEPSFVSNGSTFSVRVSTTTQASAQIFRF